MPMALSGLCMSQHTWAGLGKERENFQWDFVFGWMADLERESRRGSGGTPPSRLADYGGVVMGIGHSSAPLLRLVEGQRTMNLVIRLGTRNWDGYSFVQDRRLGTLKNPGVFDQRRSMW